MDAVYVPGWDCHGLPIDSNQVDKEAWKEERIDVARRKSAATAAGNARGGS